MMLTNNYPSLKDRNVIVTGGASGIGAALVEAFTYQGAQVAFLDIDEVAANKLIAVLRQANPEYIPTFISCDVTNVSSLKDAFSELFNKTGAISVLINNAADDRRHDLMDTNESIWDELMSVNLKHIYFAIQSVRPAMVAAGGGSVLNLGSISWHIHQDDLPIYATAKAGVEGLTCGLARVLGADNIRINTILPGWVMTERQRRHYVDAEAEHRIKCSQCLPNSLLPEDICAMALFLASDDSKMCTAQKFVVDGGWA